MLVGLDEGAGRRGVVGMVVVGCCPVMGVIDHTAAEMRVILQEDVPAVSGVL